MKLNNIQLELFNSRNTNTKVSALMTQLRRDENCLREYVTQLLFITSTFLIYVLENLYVHYLCQFSQLYFAEILTTSRRLLNGLYAIPFPHIFDNQKMHFFDQLTILFWDNRNKILKVLRQFPRLTRIP